MTAQAQLELLTKFAARAEKSRRIVARHERQLAMMRRALDQTAGARRLLRENRRHFDQLHRLHDEALRRGEPDPACAGCAPTHCPHAAPGSAARQDTTGLAP